MRPAAWVDLAAQSIFHALVAALVMGALVRVWRAVTARDRLRLRSLAILHPLLVLPLFFLCAPVRRSESFRDGWALLVGRRWDAVQVLGVGLFDIGLAAMAALGTALFLMDLLPLLRDRGPVSAPRPAAEAGLDALPALASEMGLEVPRVVALDGGPPVLFCAGVRRPALVVSRSAVALLDAAELRAALAHELAHLEHRDPVLSWGLMAARALLFCNPAFQVMARVLARDAEWCADERAAEVVGDRAALASALLKLFRATEGRAPAAGRRSLPLAAALAGPLRRARSADVEARCRRLIGEPPEPLPLFPLRLSLAFAGLSAVLFFAI